MAVVFLETQNAAATWNQVGSVPNGYATCGWFFDSQNGIVGLRTSNVSACVLRTTNGGSTWTTVPTPPIVGTNPKIWITDIWFSNRTEGWITLYDETGGRLSSKNLWHSSDAGQTWREVNIQGNLVSVRKTTQALIVGEYSGGIRVSTDNGASFFLAQPGANNALEFVDDKHGVCTGFYSYTYFTSDGGLNWAASSAPVNEGWGVYGARGTPNFVEVPEDGNGPPGSRVYLSTDYGVSWTSPSKFDDKMTGDVEGVGSAIFVQTNTFASNLQGLYRSSDYGYTWKSIGGPNNSTDTRFVVLECGRVIYAFDDRGGIFKTVDGGDGTSFGPCSNPINSRAAASSVCDTTSELLYVPNYLTDPITVLDVRVLDSTRRPNVTEAFGFDSMLALPHRLAPYDSLAIRFGWRPRKLSSSRGVDSVTIQTIYQTQSGEIDTVVMRVYLKTLTPYPKLSLDAASIRLDRVDSCYKDTTLTISNPNCDTLWITRASLNQGRDWQVFDPQGLPVDLPYPIPSGGSLRYIVRYTTSSIGLSRDTLLLVAKHFDRDTTAMIALSAQPIARDPLAGSPQIDLGQVSLCAPSERILNIPNPNCSTLVLTSFSIDGSEWTLLDSLGQPVTTPFRIAANSVAHLRLRLVPASPGRKQSTLDLRFNYLGGLTVHMLNLDATVVAGASTIGLLPPTAVFADRTECDRSDTVLFTIRYPGCDSMLVRSATLFSGTAFSYQSSRTLPYLLRSNDSIEIRVALAGLTPGNYSDRLTIHLEEADGSLLDTSATVTAAVLASPHVLQWSTVPLDFGTIRACQSRDTMIVFSNKGCTPITVTDEVLTGNGMLLLSQHSTPYTLQPGETDTIVIGLDASQSGSHSGILQLRTTADNGGLYSVALTGVTPPLDSVLFTLRLSKDPVAAGDFLTLTITPDRSVSSKGLRSIDAAVEYAGDAFQEVSRSSGMTGFTSTSTTRLGKLDQIHFRITGSDITLDPAVPLLTLQLRRTITDSVDIPIMISSIMLNGDEPGYMTCSLASPASSVTSHLDVQCGDDILMRSLQGQPLLYVSPLKPNPLSLTNAHAGIYVRPRTSGTLTVDLISVSGQALGTVVQSISAGVLQYVELPMESIRLTASGRLWCRLRFESTAGIAVQTIGWTLLK